MRLIGCHFIEQRLNRVGMDQDVSMLRPDEAGVDHMPVEGDELVIEARHIQQANGLGMITQLRPADRLP